MTLERMLRGIVIGGVFALPFVCILVTESLFFPYITGKNFAFRIIVEIITGAWLALVLVNAEYRPRRSWVLGMLALFVVVMAAADAFGLYPFKSFWSNYERMDGWVTLAHLFAYTLVAASVITTTQLWRRLFQISLAVSVYIAIYGFLQLAGYSALGQGGAAGLSARVDATFGNPIYLAVYLLFHVFIAAHLWAEEWVERGKGYRLPMSLLYGSVMIFDTMVLCFTGTRGTIIGLVGGAFLAALIMVVLAKNSRTVWRFATATLISIVLLVGGFWLIRDSAFVKSVGFLDRLATISTSDNTVKARFINWSIAWQGVKERPILGWGQENYALVFDKYYDPRMYAQEPWFDRVHNIIFDWLVAGGFLGLFSYLAIFAAALGALWRPSAERGSTEASRPNVRRGVFTITERSIFTGLLAAYFCHNFFVFDNVTSYILFGTILAYIIFRSTLDTPGKVESEHIEPVPVQGSVLPYGALPFVAFFAAFLVWGTAWYVNAAPLAANRALLDSVGPQQDVLVNLEHFKRTILYGSFGTQEAREQLVQATIQLASVASVATSTKKQFFDFSVAEMEKQSEESPLDARFPLFLGIVHDAYGDYAGGAREFERAHGLSQKKQSIFFELGRNALLRGDTKKALQYYKTAYDFAPEFIDARMLYAAGAIRAGQNDIADGLLAPLIASGQAADQRVLAAYVSVGAHNKAIAIWQARIKVMPDDLQSYFTLAALFYEAGDKVQAIATLERVKAVNSDVSAQANSLIDEIKKGTAEVH